MSKRSEFVAGIRAELPLAISVGPTGLIFGAIAREMGVPPGAAAAMSSIVLAGSAQFVATQLFGAGAPGPIMLLTTFVVNLRHLLYGASLAPFLRPVPAGWKWILGYLMMPMLTDRASRIAGATAAGVAVAATTAPLKLGLIAAAAAGIVAGVMSERRAGGRRTLTDGRAAGIVILAFGGMAVLSLQGI